MHLISSPPGLEEHPRRATAIRRAYDRQWDRFLRGGRRVESRDTRLRLGRLASGRFSIRTILVGPSTG